MNESMQVTNMRDRVNRVNAGTDQEGQRRTGRTAGTGVRSEAGAHAAMPATAGARGLRRGALLCAMALMASPLMFLGLSSILPGVASGVARAAEQTAQSGPQEIITQVAQQTLKELDAHRAEYRKDPRRLRELVDTIMLPHFDTQYSAQLVLAKHWRSATPEQRQRFIEAFYQSMLQNYGEALLEFTPERLRILPYQGKADDRIATVRSEVRRDDGSRVPVNYALRKTAEGWKAFDVQIEGVSYVKSLRTDFGAEIDRQGLDSVIQRLESQVASGTVEKPAASAQPTSQS